MSDPRPGNSGRADYPRMLYQADGRMLIAHSPEEHDRLMKDGWDTVPAAIHTRPVASPAPALSGGDPLAVMVRQVLHEVLDERGVGKRRR
ncbi:MAG TPA: hypothetical protein VGI28_01770 [Stellaceae bacterium]|jgi:hypothetical protein